MHAEAATAADTDWPQILALYDLLAHSSRNPVLLLNRAVAVAMVHGPRRGLAHLAELEQDRHLAGHHRLHAVRAHLLEQAGDRAAAGAAFHEAARRCTSIPEQRYLRAPGRPPHRSAPTLNAGGLGSEAWCHRAW